MIFTHRTLLTDETFTSMCPIRNFEGKCTSIAIAKGTTMLIINPFEAKNQIQESYPFLSPIEVIETAQGEVPIVFVLLRNLNYFIMQLPNILSHGSLMKPNLCPPLRNIMSHGPFFSDQPQDVSSSTTALIRFKEKRYLHASHPYFIAVQVCHNAIHIIPLLQYHLYSEEPRSRQRKNNDSHSKRQMYVINLLYPNVISMDFLGPTSCSARLAFLASTCNSTRSLIVYKYSEIKDDFLLELEIEVPSDSHYILPLHPELESTLAIITSDGIIRVTAPEGLHTTTDRLSSFMPPIVLNACHFYDDIYLLCDCCGGLTGMNLPVDGSLVTENMKFVGPVSGIIAYDSTHFIISSPFGDCVSYTFIKHDDYIQLQEFSRIPSIGPVFSLDSNKNGLICGSGRSLASSIRLFEQAIDCEEIAQININNCLAIYTAQAKNLSETTFSIYICLCFYHSTKLVIFNGSSIEDVENEPIPLDDDTFLFAQISDNNILHLSSKIITIFNRSTCEVLGKSQLTNPVIAATLSLNHIALSDDQKIIKVIDIETLKVVKKFQINKIPLLISATEDNIAVYLIDNTIFLFSMSSSDDVKSIELPIFSIPVSMSMFNDGLIILGTSNGNVIKIMDNLSKIITQNFGESKIVLKSVNTADNPLNVLSSGDSPFIIKNMPKDMDQTANKSFCYYDSTDMFDFTDASCRFLSVNKCEDISFTDKYICCLNDDTISIYTTNFALRGTTKIRQSIHNMVNFSIIDDSTIICDVEDKGSHSLVKFINGKEVSRHTFDKKTVKLSFYKCIDLCDEKLIIVGDDQPSISLLDSNLHRVAYQKMLAMPLTACVYQQYLVVSRDTCIDFFVVKNVDGSFEMERTAIVPARIMSLDFLIINNYLVASDIQEALIVYKCDPNKCEVELVSQDHSPKQLTYLVNFGGFIFAASLTSNVYAYSIDENGMICEIGSYQCSSIVTAFAAKNNNLFYGTDGGGIGVFSTSEETNLVDLEEIIMNDDNLMVLADHIPRKQFEWDQREMFVDIDNLNVLKSISPQDLKSLLRKAKVDFNTFFASIQTFHSL